MELIALFDVTNVTSSGKQDIVYGSLAEAPDKEGVDELKLHSSPTIGFVVTNPELLGKLKAGAQFTVSFSLNETPIKKESVVVEEAKRSDWMVHR